MSDTFSPATIQDIQARTQAPAIAAGTRAYADLRAKIIAEGILDRSYAYYTMLFVFVAAGFSLGIYRIFTTELSFALLGWCIATAMFTVQLAGFMHDAVHRAIFATTKANDIIGHVVCAFVGMGYNDWKTNHNRHHASPNQKGEDPDIELPVLSFTNEQYVGQTGIGKMLRRYQTYLYYPMGLLVGLTIRLAVVQYFLRHRDGKTVIEALFYFVGIFSWFILPFFVFDFAKAIMVFSVVNGLIGIYLFNIFAPNHKGMPQLQKGTRISFFEQQVLTSRNINNHWLTDFLYLGLNYQIEHHLFPTCPRNKLHLITPHLLEACRRLRLEYTQVSVLESNRIILHELSSITQSAEKLLTAKAK